jgi:hypothetical protein
LLKKAGESNTIAARSIVVACPQCSRKPFADHIPDSTEASECFVTSDTMNFAVHEIDPDADTVIVLRSPRSASCFAIWFEEDSDDDDTVAMSAPPLTSELHTCDTTESITSIAFEVINIGENAATLDSATPAVQANTPPHNPASAQSEEEESTGNNAAAMSALLIHLKLNTSDTVEPDTPIRHNVETNKANAAIRDKMPTNAPPHILERSVLYYASSHHLILASPIFKSALSGGNWSEG